MEEFNSNKHCKKTKNNHKLYRKPRNLNSSSTMGTSNPDLTSVSGSKKRGNCFVLNKIFIGGIENHISEADLKTYFSQFGQLISTKILVSPKNDKRRGFGFVKYRYISDYERVIDLRFHEIKGVSVECKPAKPVESPKTNCSCSKHSAQCDVDVTVDANSLFLNRLESIASSIQASDYLGYFFGETSKYIVNKDSFATKRFKNSF